MDCIGKIWFGAILSAFILLFIIPPVPVSAENLVIVIDPGHGGNNEGALYDGYTEKEMTLTVAQAMREELLKYDQVEVYLTRETDIKMSIKDRAAFAAEKHADFLFCLHFNTSEERNYFGAEVWVPSQGEYYARGYTFAQLEMLELGQLGLCSRGIKTRLDTLGNDYYGILRYCTREGVPSALIEHCHLDHEKDKPFYQQSEEQLREFGRLDARAVAKYFGLSSEETGTDYSDYVIPVTEIPDETVAPDKTEPELCRAELDRVDGETGEITVQVTAEDSDSYILYYGYSLDGGKTWSSLEAWPRPGDWNRSEKEHTFTLTVPFEQELALCVKVYNGFDLYTVSDTIFLPPIPDPERLEEEERLAREQALQEAQKGYQEIHYGDLIGGEDTAEGTTEASGHGVDALSSRQIVLAIGLILLLMAILSFFMARMLFLLLRGNKRR